jgi:hypothetical protein
MPVDVIEKIEELKDHAELFGVSEVILWAGKFPVGDDPSFEAIKPKFERGKTIMVVRLFEPKDLTKDTHQERVIN